MRKDCSTNAQMLICYLNWSYCILIHPPTELLLTLNVNLVNLDSVKPPRPSPLLDIGK